MADKGYLRKKIKEFVEAPVRRDRLCSVPRRDTIIFREYTPDKEISRPAS